VNLCVEIEKTLSVWFLTPCKQFDQVTAGWTGLMLNCLLDFPKGLILEPKKKGLPLACFLYRRFLLAFVKETHIKKDTL
jgi:hypothetical protein